MPTSPGGRRERLVLAAGCTALALSLSGCDNAVADSHQSETSLPPPSAVSEVVAATTGAGLFDAPGVLVGYDYTRPSSIAVVVSKTRPLEPVDYVPPDLVELAGIPQDGTQRMRSEAASAFTSMWTAANEAGVFFRVESAYRSYDQQRAEYNGYVAQWGRANADRGSARPGYSEHQTGLAVDVNDVPDNLYTAAFASSPAGVWLAEHAHEFGFIISYPQGKESVTGYRWEPWHLRYVGTEIAQRMKEQGVSTLQEFMGLEASPDYD